MTAARRGVPGSWASSARPGGSPRLARPLPIYLDSAAMAEELRYERIGAAALLTIDRPARRNAIDAAAAASIRRGLKDFEADEDARVLVLTGAGGEAFCAGAPVRKIGRAHV